MNQLATNTKIEEVLEEQGFFMCSTVGYSMFPMLRDRQDIVVVVPAAERLKKNDVALYKRGDGYILHRVIKVMPDHYVIRGDNCYYKEMVTDEMVLGVLKEFHRGTRNTLITDSRFSAPKVVELDSFKYKMYVKLWPCTYPFRWAFQRAKNLARKILK